MLLTRLACPIIRLLFHRLSLFDYKGVDFNARVAVWRKQVLEREKKDHSYSDIRALDISQSILFSLRNSLFTLCRLWISFQLLYPIGIINILIVIIIIVNIPS